MTPKHIFFNAIPKKNRNFTIINNLISFIFRHQLLVKSIRIIGKLFIKLFCLKLCSNASFFSRNCTLRKYLTILFFLTRHFFLRLKENKSFFFAYLLCYYSLSNRIINKSYQAYLLNLFLWTSNKKSAVL